MAIDFTGSNRDPKRSDSLHYLGGRDEDNKYLEAIKAVGNILSYYDSDQMFPVYGFGGNLPSGEFSNCFALNGDFYKPEAHGI